MTAQDLKNSILQLAIQGKLVEQREEEETAEELYKQIQEEKQRLIKEKKIKKSKPLPEITDEEIPFDIPGSWKWIKLGMLCSLAKGEKVNNVKLPYLEAKYLRGNKEALIKNSGQLVNKNQYIILVDGQNSGEVFMTKEKGILGSTFKVLKFTNYIFNQYLLNILNFYKITFINNKKGAAIPHLNKDLFNNILIGLPPLQEQKRIVEKFEELIPYIDKYNTVYNELTKLNNSFPTDIEKSILQYAIQGKLVEQREEEGTAEELYKQIQEKKQRLIKERKIKKSKPLPEITEEEIPFDIPESWKWVRLGNLCNYGKNNSISSNNIPEEDWVLDLEDIEKNTAKIINKKRKKEKNCVSNKHIFKRGNILYSKLRPYLNKVIIADENGYSTSEILALDFGDKIYNKYAQKVLMNPYFITYATNCSYGVKMPRLGTKDGQIALFPLPPYSEQFRIVEKFEEVMNYTKKFK